MHNTVKWGFELSNILGSNFPTEIVISLAFMASFPGKFAKRDESRRIKKQSFHRPHKGAN